MTSDTGRTVAVRIFGGLGNQMFQYAAGRAAALHSGAELRLDLRHFDQPRAFAYGLSHLSIGAPLARASDVPPLREKRIAYRLWRMFNRPPYRIREKGMAFDPQLLDLPNRAYLEGYWQSERFFENCIPQIRQEFAISAPPSDDNLRHLEAITATPAVSLHVRRGDYLLPIHASVHGLCSEAYYQAAVKFVAERMSGEPVIYVFSDEPQWARDNLRFPFETRVMGHNDSAHNYEDLRLMSACSHHIIANSSFSWWGAWLNPSPGKIVVAPERWFADPKLHNPDITPAGWHRLVA